MSITPNPSRAREPQPAGEGRDESLPLYVDLDGTLISTDTLWEAICALAAHRPQALLGLPLTLLRRGRAGLKAEVSSRWGVDASSLPYRPEVLEYLEQARSAGRPLVLASASDARTVRAVAEHLGLFDAVLASDGGTNLRSAAKLSAIRAHSAEALGCEGRFEYIGDSTADLPILREADRATLVAPSRNVRAATLARHPDAQTLAERSSWIRPTIRAMRPFQWAKNLLIFAPLLLAHRLTDLERWWQVCFTFLAFSLVASGTYMVNDLLDIDGDRKHPRKRERPFAAGTLSIPTGILVAFLLIALPLIGTAWLLPNACVYMLTGYLVMTLSYSMHLKEQALIDVLVLAGLYTHRILTGGVAAGVPVSPWLLAFSGFFFFSLALVKRYVELRRLERSAVKKMDRRAYHTEDVSLVETMGMSAGYIAVLVLCLFISSRDVSALYRTPILLWLMCPVMLYWISRVWILARRDELHDDPVLFAVRDRTSYVCGLLIALVMVGASL